jgi:hypothetical protein
VDPGITAAYVITLISAMRGLIQAVSDGTPQTWPRFLDIPLAGLAAPPSLADVSSS